MPCRSMSPSIFASTAVSATPRADGDVGDARHQARAERVQEELDRGRRPVGADEHRGVVGVVGVLGDVRVLAAGAGERLDGRAAVGADHPAVRGAELELGQLPAAPHDVDRAEEAGDVHAVAGGRFGGGAHAWLPRSGVAPVGATGPTMRERPRRVLESTLEEFWRTAGRRAIMGDVIFEFEEFELDTERFELRRAGPGPSRRAPGVRRAPLPGRAPRPRRVRRRSCSTTCGATGSSASRRSRAASRRPARRSATAAGQQRVIATAHGRGYRFLPRRSCAGEGDAASSRPSRRDIRYARSGDVNIAYEVTGGGPIDIVLVARLRLPPRDRLGGPALGRVPASASGGMGRLIRFDKRGTGLSDRPPDLPDLETRMDDVRAVMDAAGSERAVVFGVLGGRADGRPLRGDLSGAHAKRSCSTAPTPSASGPTTTRGPRHSRNAWSTPRRPRPSGASGPTCSACARTPTTRWPSGGSAGPGRPPAPAPPVR